MAWQKDYIMFSSEVYRPNPHINAYFMPYENGTKTYKKVRNTIEYGPTYKDLQYLISIKSGIFYTGIDVKDGEKYLIRDLIVDRWQVKHAWHFGSHVFMCETDKDCMRHISPRAAYGVPEKFYPVGKLDAYKIDIRRDTMFLITDNSVVHVYQDPGNAILGHPIRYRGNFNLAPYMNTINKTDLKKKKLIYDYYCNLNHLIERGIVLSL